MDALASVVLRRAHTVQLPALAAEPVPDGQAWTRALEADLLKLGLLLTPEATSGLASMDRQRRVSWSDWLLAEMSAAVGHDRTHVPLFRLFPDVPDTDALFVDRLLVQLFQAPGAPCVLCAGEDLVRPLSPCGHLVCASCFEHEAFSGCPLCGRRIDSPASFLEPHPPARPRKSRPVRWTRLEVTADLTPVAARLRDELVSRTTPLSPSETDDLKILVRATGSGSLDWLPPHVPVRETAAVALASVLLSARPDEAAELAPGLTKRWLTTTDVARTLWVFSDGDAGLTLPRNDETTSGPRWWWRPSDEPELSDRTPRVRALPRWLRRAALSRINEFALLTVAEDLARHATLWKRLGERLHPFEQVERHPTAAVGFAALRGTFTPTDSVLARAIHEAATAHPERVLVTTHPSHPDRIGVRIRSFSSLVEQAFGEDDPLTALDLLGTRPGDLWRRLDHLARELPDDPAAHDRLTGAASRTARAVSPAVLLSAVAQLPQRPATLKASRAPIEKQIADHGNELRRRILRNGGPPLPRWRLAEMTRAAKVRPPAPLPGTPRRVFFPDGDVVRTWTEPEGRDPIAPPLAEALQDVAYLEIVDRARPLSPYDVVAVDAALADVPLPLRARASSDQLAGWTRGARIPLQEHEGILRLFLHWTDASSTRVDLDLSCAFFGSDWSRMGHCDYTVLRPFDGVQHSGDLTSAPAPLGATEYVDLDVPMMRARGVRWAVPVVFSYNDVAFEHLDKAFAGLMLPLEDAEAFQAERVAQRFELRGRSRALVPMVIDLDSHTLLWADLNLSTSGYAHSLGGNSRALARLGADIWDYFDSGERATVFDLVVLHAIGRARDLVVVRPDGERVSVPMTGGPARVLAGAREAARAHFMAPTPVVGPGPALVAAVRAEDLDRVRGTMDPDRCEHLVAVGAPPTSGASVVEVSALLSTLSPG